jgi:hypothetical protein
MRVNDSREAASCFLSSGVLRPPVVRARIRAVTTRPALCCSSSTSTRSTSVWWLRKRGNTCFSSSCSWYSSMKERMICAPLGHDLGWELRVRRDAPAHLVVDEQDALEQAVLAHQVLGGGDLLVRLRFLRGGGLLDGGR